MLVVEIGLLGVEIEGLVIISIVVLAIQIEKSNNVVVMEGVTFIKSLYPVQSFSCIKP